MHPQQSTTPKWIATVQHMGEEVEQIIGFLAKMVNLVQGQPAFVGNELHQISSNNKHS